MTDEQAILQNSLLLTYLHSKMSLKNAEVVLHQMKVTEHPLLGRIQHKFEKLINAHRNAMGILEKNIQDKQLLESDIEEMIDQNWKVIQES